MRQEERHKASVEWRVKLFCELKARPEWVAAWRVAKRMDERVEELCERKGLRFAHTNARPGGCAVTRSCRRPRVASIIGLIASPWRSGYAGSWRTRSGRRRPQGITEMRGKPRPPKPSAAQAGLGEVKTIQVRAGRVALWPDRP
jgi:hypothetical protein